jgi:hypothetical protein
MGQTSRIVTIMEGVQATDVTTFDRDGEPMGTYYPVLGGRTRH